jgi:tetratricopeptide (TPR) repeat protein
MGCARRLLQAMAVSVTLTGLTAGIVLPQPAQAETLLENRGTITPAEATYTFEGTAGQALTITLDSEDFDPVLLLLDSNGDEVAFNDDFGGSLNSKIIITLPADDTYTVVARSFAGDGGDYDLVVRDSTAFELTFAAAEALVAEEDYDGAIAAYTEAIDLDPDQASAYLGRAQAILAQTYVEQGEQIEGPADIPLAVRERVIADFEQAADLIEASDGGEGWADSLREQAAVLRQVED